MDPRAFRVAMIHMSQTEEVSPNEETPSTEEVSEKLTLDQKKKVIDDSLDSYYSPVLNAYLRQIDDVGQLMVAAQYIVSQFGDSDIPVDSFQKRLGNIRVKILNAAGDTAMDEKDSLKQTFLHDPQLNGLGKEDIDTYVRSQLGKIKRETIAKAKKIQSFMNA